MLKYRFNKRLILLLLFPILLFSQSRVTGKVVAVKDGDTIHLLSKAKKIKIRLYGIDAPEKKQAYGIKSKQRLSELVLGKSISVIAHGKDRYGRTIGELYLLDSIFVNQVLVKEGLAWWYVKYAKDNQALESAEKSARKEKVGLWEQDSPTAPWKWRKLKRKKSKKRRKNYKKGRP